MPRAQKARTRATARELGYLSAGPRGAAAESRADAGDLARPVLRQNPAIDRLVYAFTTSSMVAVTASESVGLTFGREIDGVGKEAIPFLGILRPTTLSFTQDVGAAGTFLPDALQRHIAEP